MVEGIAVAGDVSEVIGTMDGSMRWGGPRTAEGEVATDPSTIDLGAEASRGAGAGA